MNKDYESDVVILRQKAEELLEKRPLKHDIKVSETETLKLIHELEVHQIELELQNTELKLAMSAAQDAIELYDFAPSGFFTLSRSGDIINLNLCGARMLEKERTHLKNSRFGFFVSEDTRPIFNLFLSNLFSLNTNETCEVRLLAKHNLQTYVHLSGITSADEEYCYVTAIDITEKKQSELAVLQTKEALTFLAQYSRTNQENDFFRLLAQYLSKALEADFVCIDRLEGDGLNARTLAVWCDGAFEDNVAYTLKDTPCGMLAGKTVCCFPASVCQLFPNDIVLQDLKAESYVGATLWGHSGNAIGLIAVIKRNQLINPRQAEELLKLVAVRAAAEMERIEVEEALRESEQKSKDLFEANTDGITIFSLAPDGPPSTIVAMNQNAARMLGYTREEMLKMNPNELEKNIDDEKIEKRKQDLQTKGYSNFETILLHKNGSEINVEIKVSVVDYNNQLALMNIVRNITERKQAIEALAESEEKFREMANLLPQIVFESDFQGKLSYVNKQAFKTLGYPEDFPIIGINTLDFFTQESKVRALDNIQSRLSGKQKAESNEYVMIRKDGSTFPALLYSNLVIKKSKPIGLRGIVVDITDRKRIEEEIKEQNEELQKISAEKDKFFSIIAHDLRNPFNSFLGLTKIIAEDLPTLTMAEVQKIALSMSNSATHLYHLLENLLEWSRMKQGLIPFEPEVIEFLPIVEESIALMVEPAKNKGIGLSYDISDDIVVFADRNMLQTIIRNLVSNAMKFTSKGGNVNLSAKPVSGKSIEVSIMDSGIGMNQLMMDNLFRPNGKTNRNGTEGEPSSGLGLMICKEFIEKHGGKLWVESEDGKGSNFCFTMPYQTYNEPKGASK